MVEAIHYCLYYSCENNILEQTDNVTEEEYRQWKILLCCTNWGRCHIGARHTIMEVSLDWKELKMTIHSCIIHSILHVILAELCTLACKYNSMLKIPREIGIFTDFMCCEQFEIFNIFDRLFREGIKRNEKISILLLDKIRLGYLS